MHTQEPFSQAICMQLSFNKIQIKCNAKSGQINKSTGQKRQMFSRQMM